MNYRRPVTLDVLSVVHAALMFATVYPFLAGLLGFSGSTFRTVSAAGILMILPVAASFFLNRKIKSLIVFFLLGAAITAGCCYLARYWGGGDCYSGFVCGAATAVGTAIIFGFRIYTRILYGKEKRKFYAVHSADTPFDLKGRELPSPLNSPKLYHLLWFSGLYLLGMILHLRTTLYILFAMVFADIFVCLGYRYISALYEYIRTNRRLIGLPLNAMKKIHQLAGISGALLLALFLLPSLLYGREFEPKIATREPVKPVPQMVQQGNYYIYGPDIPDTEAAEASEPQKETPKWVETLLKIFGCLVAVSSIVIAAVLLFHIIRSLEKEFSEPEEKDEVVFLKRGRTVDGKTSADNMIREGIFSKRQQIRRRYRRLIRKHTKGIPSPSATPTELERNAALSGSPEMNELHEIYEKVRYDRP